MKTLRTHALRHAFDLAGCPVHVRGWVRTVRRQKAVSFLEVNDGSSVKGCQVVAPTAVVDLIQGLGVGCSVSVRGRAQVGRASHGEIEVHVGGGSIGGSIDGSENAEVTGDTENTESAVADGAIDVVGPVDAASFPLQKKYQSLEFLRDHLHLRTRTNTAGAVLRVRHRVASAVRRFLDRSDFIEVNTPIITANDCEGAGELFEVRAAAARGAESQEVGRDTGGETEGETEGEAGAGMFFKLPVFLTVSGQMHAEALACSMGRVYTFGPTFRAENSHTSRHLAEFWMIEPEMAFATMDDAIDIAQGTIQATFHDVLEKNAEDVDFFGAQQVMAQKMKQKGQSQKKTKKTMMQQQHTPNHVSGDLDVARPPREMLEMLTSSSASFARMTYTEAVAALNTSGRPASQVPAWGQDLSSDQERWLVEQHCGYTPLIVTDYPASVKPFYMRQNDDGKTVAAFDILLPGVGEVVGGSAREERLDLLEVAMQKNGIHGLEWYADLRRHGSVPHAGFGVGMERLVMACTGVKNVRDVVPFPRTPGWCTL
jgi:asparaginyl-tRNA synthetase